MTEPLDLIQDLHAALCEALESLAHGNTSAAATILKGARDQSAEYIIEQAESEQ
jgi:hypothetical protein